MKKPFIEAQVKELLGAVSREQITFSRMVEQLNRVANERAHEVAKEALKNASENLTQTVGQWNSDFSSQKQSILNENNIPELL